MPKVLLNSGSSSPQDLPTKIRLNISSNSRRTPNKSSNSLSVVYKCFISSSSIEFRLTRGGAPPLPRNKGQEFCQVSPRRLATLPVVEAEPQASPFLYIPGSLGNSFPWQLVSFRIPFLRQPSVRNQ